MRNDYGVGAGLLAAATMLQNVSRTTGRTTNLLGRVKDGEIVVAPSHQIAKHIERELKDLGTKARVAICGASFREVMASSLGWPRTVIHFDHTWVEAFYQWSIEDTRNELFKMQDELSRRPPPASEPTVREWVE